MHCLTIHVGQVIWTMLFKDEQKAKEAESLMIYQPETFGLTNKITIADDFGQVAYVLPRSLHGWLLEDLDQSKLAHIEKGIHNAHTQADYARRAQSDPALRAGAQGPAIYSPGGNGLFRQ